MRIDTQVYESHAASDDDNFAQIEYGRGGRSLFRFRCGRGHTEFRSGTVTSGGEFLKKKV